MTNWALGPGLGFQNRIAIKGLQIGHRTGPVLYNYIYGAKRHSEDESHGRRR